MQVHKAHLQAARGAFLGARLTRFEYWKRVIYFINNTNCFVFLLGFMMSHGGRQCHLPHNWSSHPFLEFQDILMVEDRNTFVS